MESEGIQAPAPALCRVLVRARKLCCQWIADPLDPKLQGKHYTLCRQAATTLLQCNERSMAYYCDQHTPLVDSASCRQLHSPDGYLVIEGKAGSILVVKAMKGQSRRAPHPD